MLVNKTIFRAALKEALTMTPEQLLKESGADRARSYFVCDGGRRLPMKAVTKLAYVRAGLAWDRRQSKAVAAVLSQWGFDVVHLANAKEEQKFLNRQRESAERWARKGQGKFRAAVLNRFNGICCISGCTAEDALDASHINAVANDGDDNPLNGWLLRADLHRLFDAWMMSVDPSSGFVHFANDIIPSYEDMHKSRVSDKVELSAFKVHWTKFRKKSRQP